MSDWYVNRETVREFVQRRAATLDSAQKEGPSAYADARVEQDRELGGLLERMPSEKRRAFLEIHYQELREIRKESRSTGSQSTSWATPGRAMEDAKQGLPIHFWNILAIGLVGMLLFLFTTIS